MRHLHLVGLGMIAGLLPTAAAWGVSFNFLFTNGSAFDAPGGVGLSMTETDGSTSLTITTLDVLAPEYADPDMDGIFEPTGNILSAAGGSSVGTSIPTSNTLVIQNTSINDAQYNASFGVGGEGSNINLGEAWIMEFDKSVLLSNMLFQSLDAVDELTIAVEGIGSFVLSAGAGALPLGLNVIPAGADIRIGVTGTVQTSIVRIPGLTAQVVEGFVDSAASGDASAGTTWADGMSPREGFFYQVLSGHTVALDSATFGGDALLIESGGAIDFATNAVQVPLLIADAGSTITESTIGDFFLGDINAIPLATAQIDGDVTINAENGGDVGLDVQLAGSGNIVVNSTAGTTLFVTNADSFQGTVQFNGQGDEIAFFEAGGGGGTTFEMNSTGGNNLVLSTTAQVGAGNIIFNQPSTIDHRPGDATGGQRLQQFTLLEANADVTVDLTKTYTGNERRLLTGEWRGAANITVNGTPTDPTSGDVTLNEFEIGSTTPDNVNATQLQTNSYSGTVTLNNFLNAEIREHTPSASYIVNQNAVMEVGHDGVTNLFTTELGEVTVNSGGTFEVGHETDSMRVPYSVRFTTSGGKSGDLTLNSGARTLLQISGTGDHQFDQIFAEGTVTLGGTVEILVDPTLTAATTHATQGGYTPTAGDTFDLIVAASAQVAGDYDDNGTVGQEDYDLWTADFGSTTALAADGNGNGVVDAADYTIWQDNLGASGGAAGIIDVGSSFSNLVITDPNGVLAGFSASLNVTSSAVQLVIAAAGGTGAAVPEPSTIMLALVGLVVGCCFMRRPR